MTTAMKPMFTFSTSSMSPTYRVRCHNCGWTVKGNPRKVDGEYRNTIYPQADTHVCPIERSITGVS